MTDQLTKAVEELQEKSPFVCISCGHPHDIAKVREQSLGESRSSFHDDFSEAVEEEGEKTAFKCESCGHHQIVNKK